MGIAILKESDLLEWATLKERRKLGMILDRQVIEHLVDHWRLANNANASHERVDSTGSGYEVQWWD